MSESRGVNTAGLTYLGKIHLIHVAYQQVLTFQYSEYSGLGSIV